MLPAMKYKGFTWPNNPRVFEASASRRIVTHKLPFSGCIMQDMGSDCRVFSGEGEFVGEDAYYNFRRLSEVFSEGGEGVLTHPVWPAVRAYFTKLVLREEPRENYVRYSFEFSECPEQTGADTRSPASGEPRYYTVQTGDVLGAVAAGRAKTVDELLRLNPMLRNPNVLTAGMLLRVE